MLNGRAIYVLDPVTGENRVLTRPGAQSMDDGPHWTPDGKRLTYARRYADHLEGEMFKRILLNPTLLGFLLVAASCSPASIPTPMSGPPTPVSTAQATILPSAGPTPTLSQTSILDIYPLGLGATWAYSATLDYEEDNKPVHWTGTMTETITSVTTQDSAFVFGAEWQGGPAHSGFGLPISQYVALGNRIYTLRPPTLPESLIARQGQGYESAQALAWPMSVGEQWGDPRDMARGNGYLVWRVEGKDDLTTPAGTFKDCYRLFFLTNPDDTTRWFCPGVGIARYEYHHHGSLFDEVWELQRRVP